VRPDVVAGHSVGAFAAAVSAEVFTFAEAVAAVRLRGDAMAQACSSGKWGMAALTGLPLRVASHGPVQRSTADVMAQHLSTIPRRDLRAAYMTNIGSRRVRNDSAAVLDDLATAVAHPVRWFDIMRLLPELGVVDSVEMPPGDVLSRLVTATTLAVRAFSVSDDGLDPITARLRSPLLGSVPQRDHRAKDFFGPT
jgi:malonate decarboxylase epsilon subunit